MLARYRLRLLLPALVLIAGCMLPSRTRDTHQEVVSGMDGREAAGAPAEPHQPAPQRSLLLGTGAIQLGPGLGKNADRWLGDGQWGF
jgi:hypothetical protein